jgi:hypothetical protein
MNSVNREPLLAAAPLDPNQPHVALASGDQGGDGRHPWRGGTPCTRRALCSPCGQSNRLSGDRQPSTARDGRPRRGATGRGPTRSGFSRSQGVSDRPCQGLSSSCAKAFKRAISSNSSASRRIFVTMSRSLVSAAHVRVAAAQVRSCSGVATAGDQNIHTATMMPERSFRQRTARAVCGMLAGQLEARLERRQQNTGQPRHRRMSAPFQLCDQRRLTGSARIALSEVALGSKAALASLPLRRRGSSCSTAGSSSAWRSSASSAPPRPRGASRSPYRVPAATGARRAKGGARSASGVRQQRPRPSAEPTRNRPPERSRPTARLHGQPEGVTPCYFASMSLRPRNAR